VLSAILGDPSVNRDNLHQALKAYEHVRQPFVTHVQRCSIEIGEIYDMRSIYGDDEVALVPALRSKWDWLFDESVQDQVERGLQWISNAS
jgi:salicylate hydroxylase